MPSPLPPAYEILARTRQVYRECASYEDTAESTARKRVAGQPQARTTIVRSWTAFERPDRLRFESVQVGVGPEDEWRRGVAWARDGSARSWRSFQPDAIEREDLFEAAMHASIPSPAALRVLALLLPDAKPHDPFAEDGIVAGVEHLDGVPCFVLELENVHGRTLRVHVERDTYLVRRTEETLVVDAAAREEIYRRTRDNLDSGTVPEGARHALRDMLARGPAGMPDTETQRITVFRPTLDPHIEPERFSFVPPAPPEILTAADQIVVRSSVQAPEVLARSQERGCGVAPRRELKFDRSGLLMNRGDDAQQADVGVDQHPRQQAVAQAEVDLRSDEGLLLTANEGSDHPWLLPGEDRSRQRLGQQERPVLRRDLRKTDGRGPKPPRCESTLCGAPWKVAAPPATGDRVAEVDHLSRRTM